VDGAHDPLLWTRGLELFRTIDLTYPRLRRDSHTEHVRRGEPEPASHGDRVGPDAIVGRTLCHRVADTRHARAGAGAGREA
jgi:hypothetical protein